MSRDAVSPLVAVLIGIGLILVSEVQLHYTFHYYFQADAIGIICLVTGFVKAIAAVAAAPAARIGSRAMAITALFVAGILTPVFTLRAYTLIMNIA